jgi:hypothetical protein
MKAQRRHELKTNTLANQIIGLPDYWRLYGGKVLLGLCAVLAVVLFLKYQHGQTVARQQRVSDAYGMALADYSALRSLAGVNDEKFVTEQRRQLQDRIDAQIREVLDETKDDAMKADALVLRGDLNWTLATMPDKRGATTTTSASTQSTSRPTDTRDDYLDGAKRAYEAAMTTPNASVLAICKSRLALGAIAEQRGDWDGAKKQYESMSGDTATPAPFREVAKLRIDELSRIQKPPLIGKPATLPTTTQPSESSSNAGPLGPELPATTRASMTRPATQPATPNAPKK